MFTRAPKHLWQEVRDLIVPLFDLFGFPAEMAKKQTLSARLHKVLSLWLRTVENLLRRLLLIEAAALGPVPIYAPRPKHRRRGSRTQDLARPETWSVSLRVLEPNPLPRAARHRKSVRTPRAYTILPLARRAEAVLRVFNNPVPYAQRLARWLTRTFKRRVAAYHETPHLHRTWRALRSAAVALHARCDSS